MTYTHATIDGVVLWREDIFESREEADAALARCPQTASGTDVVVVSTEQANDLNAMRKELYAELERAKELLGTARTAKILAQ